MEMHYWPPYIRSTDNRGGGITAPSRFQDGGDTNGDGTENGGNNSEARELAFVLARNDADFTRAMLMRALALEKAIYGQRRARA